MKTSQKVFVVLVTILLLLSFKHHDCIHEYIYEYVISDCGPIPKEETVNIDFIIPLPTEKN